MNPAETILAVDICQTADDPITLLKHHGIRAHIALSDQALYLVRHGGRTLRLALADISQVAFQEPPEPGDLIGIAAYAAGGDLLRIVAVHTSDGGFIAMLPEGRGQTAQFGAELKARAGAR